MEFNGLQNLTIFQSSPAFSSFFDESKNFRYLNKFSNLLLSTEAAIEHLSLNTWLNPQLIRFKSISDAAKKLKSIQKNWIHVPNVNFRKAQLISDQLAPIKAKVISLAKPIPDSPIGHWTLISDDTMIAASACTSKVPNGIYNFEENKEPPSRAYLKLWELFKRIGFIPNPESTCLDLGASPGGWSWVLSNLTNEVISIDKSPLINLDKKNIRFVKHDILKTDWHKFIDKIDWIFCDAALDPDKIIPIIDRIIKDYPKISFVCTLKQKGCTLTKETNRLLYCRNSKVISLYNNKHEFTWYRINSGTYKHIL